jgi:hypothetical protein
MFPNHFFPIYQILSKSKELLGALYIFAAG